MDDPSQSMREDLDAGFRGAGDTVDVYEGALFGEFTLQPDQTLRGYIKPANNMPAIPAKIGLF